jgi:vacuolar-type H+-ATPase subunit H
MTDETATAPDVSLAPIKQVTTEEADFAARLNRLREAHKVELAVLQKETERALTQARADAERAREATLSIARDAGEREAETILRAGAAHAEEIRGKTSSELGRLKDDLLSATLAEFRPSGKSPDA